MTASITRRLNDEARQRMTAGAMRYGDAFGERVTEVFGLFLDARLWLPDTGTLVYRFSVRQALDQAEAVLAQTYHHGGDLAATAAGVLFVAAQRDRLHRIALGGPAQRRSNG